MPRIHARVGDSTYVGDWVELAISDPTRGLEWEAKNDDDPLRSSLQKTVCADPISLEGLSRARNSFTSCLIGHDGCHRAEEGGFPLPTRVLRVGNERVNPSLYVTRKEVGRWACLSYCWGGDSGFLLTEESFPKMKQGQLLNEFPPTIRDAIIVTRALGVEFLWVDALCILQDSREDWEVEARKMSEIYSNAVVTIEAAAASSVFTGILQTPKLEPVCQLPWNIPALGFKDVKVIEDRIAVTNHKAYRPLPDPGNSPWAARGWTLQEHLLSWRTLSYTSDQMLWHCPSSKIWEDGTPPYTIMQTGKLPHLAKYKINEQQNHSDLAPEQLPPKIEVYSDWYMIMKNYSNRHLTKESDNLVAIGGLAKNFQNYTRDAYCAGLWKGDLIFGLIWRFNRRQAPLRTQKLCPRLPSWNWFSLDDGTYWCFQIHRDEREDNYKEVAKIEEVFIKHSSEGIYGSVESGEIVLTGPCYPNQDIETIDHQSYQKWPKFSAVLAKELASDEEFQERRQKYAGQIFATMQLARVEGSWSRTAFLVLQSLPQIELLAVKDADIQYRRVALIVLGSPNISTQSEAPEATQELIEQPWHMKTLRVV